MAEQILAGKTGVVFGVANKRSIAWAIAKAWTAAGARLIFNYQGERLKENVEELVGEFGAGTPLYPCDVSKDEEIDSFFEKVRGQTNRLDLLLHSVAFAPKEALEGDFLNTTRDAFRTAHDISAYSLVALSRSVTPLMTDGGSILAMIEALKLAGDSGRRFHLFDTFSSADMFETNEPTDEDQPFGSTLEEMMNGIQKSGFDLSVELAGVRGTIAATGYASDKIMFHVGRTEDTIGSAPIEAIGLLRLDTDWYDSTRDQLERLFDKVQPGGIVIFDDYGFWQGHKKAVDEFLVAAGLHPLLIRTDWSCRFLVKN